MTSLPSFTTPRKDKYLRNIVTKMNYFMNKYPESIGTVCNNLDVYLVAFITLLRMNHCSYISKDKVSLTGLFDSKNKNLLLNLVQQINLSDMLRATTTFWTTCNKSMDDSGLGLKSCLKKMYVSCSFDWMHRFIVGYVDMYELLVSQKKEDDTALMLLLNSKLYRTRHSFAGKVNWYFYRSRSSILIYDLPPYYWDAKNNAINKTTINFKLLLRFGFSCFNNNVALPYFLKRTQEITRRHKLTLH